MVYVLDGQNNLVKIKECQYKIKMVTEDKPNRKEKVIKKLSSYS